MVVVVKTKLFGLTRFQNLCIVASLTFIGLCGLITAFIFPWRASIGDGFMYPAVPSGITPSVAGGPISSNSSAVPPTMTPFMSKSYGLFYVTGATKQSWNGLAGSVCERWHLYSETSAFLSAAPMCGNSVDQASCSKAFTTHLSARCTLYNRIALFSWVTVAIIGAGMLLGAWAFVTLLFASLAEWRRFLMAAVFLSGILSLLATGGWIFMSGQSFFALGLTATFPFPILSIGAFAAITGSAALILGALYLTLLASIVTRHTERRTGKGGLAEIALLKSKGVKLEESDDEGPAPQAATGGVGAFFGMPATSAPSAAVPEAPPAAPTVPEVPLAAPTAAPAVI